MNTGHLILGIGDKRIPYCHRGRLQKQIKGTETSILTNVVKREGKKDAQKHCRKRKKERERADIKLKKSVFNFSKTTKPICHPTLLLDRNFVVHLRLFFIPLHDRTFQRKISNSCHELFRGLSQRSEGWLDRMRQLWLHFSPIQTVTNAKVSILWRLSYSD